jgi:hypothetical protein
VSSPDFDLVAASLRADRGDLKAFVEALAVKLEGALPDSAKVRRGGGGLFGGKKRVEQIEVQVGNDAYELAHASGRLECRRRTVVRGIALKNDELSVDEWIDAVSRALVDEASDSERARIALGKLLDT